MNNQKSFPLLAALLAFTAIVIGFWLPFGFKTPGLVEEWGILGLLEAGHQLFFVTPDSILSAHALRPFTVLPHAIAYALDPSSFFWFNIQQIIFFIGKGFFAYLILKRLLPNHHALAFLAGVLFIIHPSDTGLFTFRAIHIHGAVMLYVMATYFLLVYYEERRRWTLIAMWLTLATSLFMYEVAYPIVALTPLLLVWMARGINKRLVLTTFYWYLPPLATGLYSVYVLRLLREENLYQTSIRVAPTFPEILEGLTKVYARSFFTSWAEINLTSPYLLPALILTVLVFMTSLYLIRSTSQPLHISVKRYAMLFVIGLGGIFAGFFFYLLFRTHLYETLRTYYVSSLGAAISISVLVYLMTGRKQLIFSTMMTVIIGLAFVNAFNQHRHYYDISLEQQRFLGQMVEQLPTLEGQNTIYIREYTGLMETEWFFKWNQSLTLALQYIYHNPEISAVICFLPSGHTYMGEAAGPCPDSTDTILFDYSFEDELKLVNQSAGDAPTSHSLFVCWPVESCTVSISQAIPDAPVTFEFDDSQLFGAGWRTSEQDGDINFRWSINKESFILARIPDAGRYKITFRVLYYAADQDGPDVFINDVPIALVRSDHWQYEGIIPADAANQVIDEIRFVVDAMQDYGSAELGIAMDWVKIEPLNLIDTVNIDFDTNFSDVNWRGPETAPDGITFQWSIAETAEVSLGILAPNTYQITAVPLRVLAPNTYDDVELWVGQTQLDAVFDPQTQQITAVLPQTLVESDRATTLLIKVPQLVNIEGSMLGIAMDRITIEADHE